jgi:multiple sugar transport system permease protein
MEAHTHELEVRQAPRRRLPDLSGRKDGPVAQALIAPGQLLLTFIVLFPAALAIYIGFTEWNPTSGANVWHAYQYWHWFDGYWEALTSQAFWEVMWHTVLFTVVATGLEFLLGFTLALLLLKNFRGRGFVTVFFLLPMMVVPAVTGFIFFMIFQVDGPLTEAISLIAGHTVTINWLDDPSLALWSAMVADIWQWTPLMFLILLSGLVALPEDQMNAARILGAGFFDQMRYLIIPMLKPVILIALIIRAIEVFKIFDSVYLMTQGGPGSASETISTYLVKQVNINGRWGYASSVAILILILVSVVAIRAIRPIEQAQEETFEELVGAETPDDAQLQAPSVEDAIEQEARV